MLSEFWELDYQKILFPCGFNGKSINDSTMPYINCIPPEVVHKAFTNKGTGRQNLCPRSVPWKKFLPVDFIAGYEFAENL